MVYVLFLLVACRTYPPRKGLVDHGVKETGPFRGVGVVALRAGCSLDLNFPMCLDEFRCLDFVASRTELPE